MAGGSAELSRTGAGTTGARDTAPPAQDRKHLEAPCREPCLARGNRRVWHDRAVGPSQQPA
eukprot:scaffold3888_cov115-Isochrysis_galbana.AAC.1